MRTLPLLTLTIVFLAGCQSMSPVVQNDQSNDTVASEQPSSSLTQAQPPSVSRSPRPFSEDADPLLETLSLYPQDYARLESYRWPETAAQPDPDLWQMIREGFMLDHSIDDARMDHQMQRYRGNQAYFDRIIERAQRYLPYIVAEVQAREIPMELALLPVIESGFDPFAYSHGRASGLWQFIPETGAHFGLHQDWWRDGRRDIIDSTQAALNYLTQLHQFFDGDWELALAGYNAGQGNVLRALRYNESRQLPTDFWSLDTLPHETRHYLPKLIAVARIVANPEAYDVVLAPVDHNPYFAVVEFDSQIDLAQAAQLAEIPLDELYLLNPSFNQWATHPEGPHRLLLPVPQVEVFEQALAEVPPNQRVGWTRYRIQPGDALLTIARRHQTTVDVLRSVNQINGNLIRAGDYLLIPTARASADTYALSADNRLAYSQNQAPAANRQQISHTVRAGESFWIIARRYGVDINQLARWNGRGVNETIRVGETLVVWQEAAPDQTPLQVASRSEVRPVGYTVRNGDSLALIAARHNVAVNDIRQWNDGLNGDIIHPGQRLRIYVDVTQSP